MTIEEDILEEAISKLQSYSGLNVSRNGVGLAKDKFITIDGTKFNVSIIKERRLK